MPFDIDASTGGNSGLTLGSGGVLPEREGHRVWWSEGRPSAPGEADALPVLMVHGGPGGQTRSEPLAWWQGQPVRWIAIDQRGCGRSEPPGRIEANDLDALIDDMERLRESLGLARWALAAGSWGAVVALHYALRHPQRLLGLHLRSAFLGSAAEVERYLAPWESWLGETGREALGDDVLALRRMFQPATSPLQAGTGLTRIDPASFFEDEGRLALAWSRFDDAQSQPGGAVASGTQWAAEAVPAELAPSWRIFRHYASHGWFLREPLLAAAAAALRGKPLTLVHGALDACCDPATSRELALAHGEAQWIEVPEAGHRMGQAPMAAALRDSAVDWLARMREAGRDASEGDSPPR